MINTGNTPASLCMWIVFSRTLNKKSLSSLQILRLLKFKQSLYGCGVLLLIFPFFCIGPLIYVNSMLCWLLKEWLRSWSQIVERNMIFYCHKSFHHLKYHNCLQLLLKQTWLPIYKYLPFWFIIISIRFEEYKLMSYCSVY